MSLLIQQKPLPHASHELNFNKEENTIQAEHMKKQLISEQLKVFDEIISCIDSNSRVFFFVYGYGGTRLFCGTYINFKEAQ